MADDAQSDRNGGGISIAGVFAKAEAGSLVAREPGFVEVEAKGEAGSLSYPSTGALIGVEAKGIAGSLAAFGTSTEANTALMPAPTVVNVEARAQGRSSGRASPTVATASGSIPSDYRYSPAMQAVLRQVDAFATARRHETVSVDHLIYGLAFDSDVLSLMEAIGLDQREIFSRIERRVGRYDQGHVPLTTARHPTSGYVQTLTQAYQIAAGQPITSIGVLLAVEDIPGEGTPFSPEEWARLRVAATREPVPEIDGLDGRDGALVEASVDEAASAQDEVDATVTRGSGHIVPASDRAVVSTHNSQIDAAMRFLELGMRAVESWNSFDDDVERERIAAELNAIRRLLEASTVRIDLLRFLMTTSLGSFVVQHPEAPMLNQVIEAVRGINGRLDELLSTAV